MSAPASVPQVNAGNRSGAASAAAAGASNLGSANPAATFTAASRTSSDPAKAHGSFESLGDAKVSVETAPVAARTQGVSSAVLVQAHMAVAGEAGPKAAGSAAASSGAALHVGGGQPLFVGSDGGNAQSGNQSGGNGGDGQAGGQQNGGQNGGQSGGQQNGGQTAAGGGFAFGAATIGQRGFGGDAARAQFQEILATRTARPPLQGSGSVGASTGSATGSLASTAFTAGPGGPQSTLPTAMASRAEATAQGRPGAASGTAVDQVAVKLAGTAAGGGDRVTIRLNPEELGKVDVKLELGRDGLVRATISAEKPETLDMLQRDSRALEKALQEAGLKTDQGSLSFDLRGGNGQPQGNGDREPALAGSSTPVDDHPDNGDTDTALAGEPGGQRSDGSYDLVA